MNDRFSADLRRHLIETANERPADGQLAAVVKRVATTAQRRSVVARLTWFPGRIGPFPTAAVRYGLLAAALVGAALAAVMLAGGGPPVRSTVFEGSWTSIDPSDGSSQTLVVGPGATPTMQFVDAFASGPGCRADPVKVFTADGAGVISGSRLDASFPDGGGCGLLLVPIAGAYDYRADTDTLEDQDGLSWSRAEGGEAPPTRAPVTSPSTVFEATWTSTDSGDGSTQTLVVGAGTTPTVQFVDEFASGAACQADSVKVFTADGTGAISGTRLGVTFPDGGGCGLVMVPIGGVYDYDPDTDTLQDQDGLTWTRSQGDVVPPTRAPGASPTTRATSR